MSGSCTGGDGGSGWYKTVLLLGKVEWLYSKRECMVAMVGEVVRKPRQVVVGAVLVLL